MFQDKYSMELLNKLHKPNLQNKINIIEIKKAIYYLKKYYALQKRDSGEPAYSHPIAVANLIVDYCPKTSVLIIAILHDIVEDTDVTIKMIEGWFGTEIAFGVKALTRNQENNTKISAAETVFRAYYKDNKEILLIKTLDRVHNIFTIKFKPLINRRKSTIETLTAFLPVTAHLKIFDIEKFFLKTLSPNTPSIMEPYFYNISETLGLAFQNNTNHLQQILVLEQ